jgi:hypothetical protein
VLPFARAASRLGPQGADRLGARRGWELSPPGGGRVESFAHPAPSLEHFDPAEGSRAALRLRRRRPANHAFQMDLRLRETSAGDLPLGLEPGEPRGRRRTRRTA